jgi:phosphoserine phosphatase
MDLIVQSPELADGAVDAFRVACPAMTLRRRPGSARLLAVQDDARTRQAAAALGAYWRCDVAFVASDLALAHFRALAIDMDSTLITIECIDELAALAGRGPAVAAITEAAMRGEIRDYGDSLRRRVALLAGADAALLDRVAAERLRLSPGAERLVAAARKAGLRTLLVSGGFTHFTGILKQRLGFDVARANVIEIADGRLTGRVSGPPEAAGDIVDAAGKARALRELCAQAGFGTDRAIAVGDGANDLELLAAAGLSVAYRAKPVVQEQALLTLNYSGLDGVLNWFSDM